MTQPIKVLGIAPYEGMKTIMLNLAKERYDIELDVFVGDLKAGVEIVYANAQSNYDVIISRGGTADLIEQATHIPVIEVTLSVYDILRAIKLAENYADRYAIVGFPAITASAHLLCDLLQYKIDIFTIHDEGEVQSTLEDLKNQGYRMVLCDMIANTTAKRLGLSAILITSGGENITNAFDQAVKLCSSYAGIRAENAFLRNVICQEGRQTVILKDDASVFFSSLPENQLNTIRKVLDHKLPAVLGGETLKFFHTVDDTLYTFSCKAITFQDIMCAAFYFVPNPVPLSTSKNGIQYSNQHEAQDQFFNSFYGTTGSTVTLQTAIENLQQTNVPVMLIGETGTGKEQVARVIYSQSSLSTNPLIIINCLLINDKSWNLITNNYNSPFNDNNNTIFFKEISELSESRRRQLLSLIIDTKLSKRNRLIFSYSCLPGAEITEDGKTIINQLSCVTLHLPALRERIDDMPTLSSLYINALNISMSNQIIGMEPEAMVLLQEYDWPDNYTQFKRILNELALITTTPYIQTEHVAMLLRNERIKGNAGTAEDGAKIAINRTLNEINQDIIRLVVEQCKGNQTAAAKRLGISRTTLWRMYKPQ